MKIPNLLQNKRNIFSQNGEDGIIEKIFEIIGASTKICCEFGAWDGIHFSNTRQLILQGWTGIFIESDREKFEKLLQTYSNNSKVFCINQYIDNIENNLMQICDRAGCGDLIRELDLLSIDIDGLDYELFQDLKISPRVICIEINAGHSPRNKIMINREVAKENIGQSLYYFSEIAEKKGYALIGYSGNAFFVRKDILESFGLQPISPEEAYSNFLLSLTTKEKEWLFLVNRGIVPPYFRFKNLFLTQKKLLIPIHRSVHLLFHYSIQNYIRLLLKPKKKMSTQE